MKAGIFIKERFPSNAVPLPSGAPVVDGLW